MEEAGMNAARQFCVALALLGLTSVPTSAAPVGKETPPSSERLRQLQQARVEALKSQLEGQFERVKIGKDPMVQYLDCVRELTEAELELAETKEARMAAVEKMVKELTTAEADTQQLQQAGLQTKQGVAQVKAARIKAEI